jgi:hypothetical protein
MTVTVGVIMCVVMCMFVPMTVILGVAMCMVVTMFMGFCRIVSGQVTAHGAGMGFFPREVNSTVIAFRWPRAPIFRSAVTSAMLVWLEK